LNRGITLNFILLRRSAVNWLLTFLF